MAEFCGSKGPLTREHVFGQWVSRSGLDLAPVRHFAGPLNALPRDMGEQPPYRQTVKSVCAACNNGWMSNLEAVAQRVLAPFIRGESGAIAVEDQAAIATWVQKTALTAMLLSSKEQRDSGYGLDPAENKSLYARRELLQPLDDSQFWVGRFEGSDGFSAVRVTPLPLRFPDLPEPPLPQGYAMTVVLGGVVLHGVRFVIPGLAADPATELQMPQLWPSRAATEWPAGQGCTRQSFLSLADGGTLRAMHGQVRLQPRSHAAHLPESELEDGLIKVSAVSQARGVLPRRTRAGGL
ncbi:hypothetical protein [uncultured Microbacterium sp.]|uniref:hypothetical protein n=1 Tax=uncultured Microbacterium sp. TaxID=191216 RepID=UPI0025CC9DAE|nr:hypothetical protein [uncultured Microbacterium sp.]